ncbi:hypothetical protein HZH66_013707 [Vespula vulgaris]|uniref:Reverse transcriptase Ty1/copia-type domain-containing protein n=1 Tax=Vespula vulgaris TaxID=7454 RepID=A0A834MRB4_VESVU|nr:hypothetical protein HZH66_013707 [Vespula vulgaris]
MQIEVQQTDRPLRNKKTLNSANRYREFDYASLENVLDLDDKISRHKARLLAKGFAQSEGIDFYKTFAIVIRYKSIGILLVVAVDDIKLVQVHTKTTFLLKK